MMLVMTLVHGIGLFSISRVLKLKDDHLEEQEFNFESILRMCGIAMLLFALHTLEIWIFAVVYLVVAMQSLEEALYYSASAYATLGRTADYFPQDWRLLGAMEALIGFLMIGWSTAFIVSKVNKMRK
jgi:hypothetical protein